MSGKIVVITGASSGIGRATAEVLAEAGHRVVLGARRVERLAELSAKIGDASYRRLDVTDSADVQSFVDWVVAGHGRVDVIVNNAGVMPLSALERLKLGEWNRMIDVNLRGVLHGIAAGLPVMQRQGGGHFVNVASIGAHEVVPTAAVYCATKYAVWALSEGLRQETGPDIRVTTISPGVTESELADTITDADAAEGMRTYRANTIPATAIARAIAYAIEQPAQVDVNEIIVRPAA
ncbi:SDR family oxidoreductase [Amycolatopsis thermalba]|uniref:SDR family oxidoreductase n=1 Tax=Amycolatopsis thermalba TaxID=944492 RepID=A0ABY4NU77_9PSEU|nr:MULTISPECIES: SDR family oxidoreductase [Amycolatopsis]UQS23608.1 SDR family oxidoreductase [Amycolatopsis thermalba]